MLIDANALGLELAVTATTCRRMAKAGLIPSCKVGRNVRFNLAEVLKSLS